MMTGEQNGEHVGARYYLPGIIDGIRDTMTLGNDMRKAFASGIWRTFFPAQSEGAGGSPRTGLFVQGRDRCGATAHSKPPW